MSRVDTTASASRRPNLSSSKSIELFLARFLNRHLTLQVIRAAAFSMVVFLGGILSIVALDFLVGLQSVWSWSLSCFVYLVSIALVWRSGVSRLIFRPPSEEVAWQIEQIQPSLHESLLAMVQLRRSDGTSRSGSQAFLNAIERKVAHELSYLNLPTMLPAKAITKPLVWLTVLLWIMLVACFVPNARFLERFVKALVPFVAFDKFDFDASNVADPNPKVIAFHFMIGPPKYTSLPVENRTSERGDLRLIKGSKLKLEVDVDQPTHSAGLALEFPETGGKNTIALQPANVISNKSKPLSPGAVQRLSLDILVDTTFIYEVRLVSEQKRNGKRLENSYSPRFRIDAVDDAGAELKWRSIDKVPWQDPSSNNQVNLVADDAKIELSLSVADNLPVEQLIHEASINRGPWTTLDSDLASKSIATSLTRQTNDATPFVSTSTIDWNWELASMEVRSGDSISTRVTATDKKGNQTHSPTLVFCVAAKGFDPQRHASLITRCQLVTRLDSLSAAIHNDRETLRPKLQDIASASSSDAQREDISKQVTAKIDSYTEASKEIRSVALAMMKDIGRCVDQAEIELLVRLLARMEKEWFVEVNEGVSSMPRPTTNGNQPTSDRMLRAYDASCDGIKQSAKWMRQIIGLELQSAMTRDLTELRDFQHRELLKNPLANLTELSRHGEVTIHYLDSVARLAAQVEPFVTEELRGRMSEWSQWIEQTRTDLHDLIHNETLEQAPRIRSRIEKCKSELNRFRWVYHLQGNLAWDVSNGRKEVLHRSGPVWQPFSRFLSLQAQAWELTKDRTLSTDTLADKKTAIRRELIGPIAVEMTQLSDRKEIHQVRQASDPDFVSDIGLTQRAWTHLLKRMDEESVESESIRADAKAIASAFRILESYHETVEARKAVQSMLPIEQYDWQGMEAQLWSPKQWESIHSRLEIAHQWMKDAGFAHAIADRYNALRWSEPANQTQAKIQPRRDSTHINLVSAADEIRTLLSLWTETDKAAQPILDQAREVLGKLSPSVTQLAKQAADQTSQLKRTAEEMGPTKPLAPNESNPPSPASSEQLQRDLDASKQSVIELQEALIELANRQNLLDASQRETAKGSDQALKLLDSALPEMNRAMEELQSQKNAKSVLTAASVEQASSTAAKSIDALEKIAKHFSKAEAPDEQSSSAPENADDPETQSESDDAYKQAEHLAELDGSDAESLLKKLERELKRNPAMQTELSEISKSNVRSQAAELQIASDVESNLAKELENSDGNLAGEKKLRLEQLRSAVDQIDRLALRLIGHGQLAAQRAGAKELATNLEKTASALRQANLGIRALTDDSSRQDLESAANSFATELDQALKQLTSSSTDIKPVAEQMVHKEERIRQNIRSEALNIQNQNRNEAVLQAKELVIQTQRQLDASRRRLQKAQADLQQASKDQKTAQDKIKSNPADKSLENQWLRATNNAEQAWLKQTWEEQSAAQAEQVSNNAKEQLSELEKREKADLDRPNPHAALSIDQLEQAKAKLTQVQEQTSRALESLSQLPSPRTPSRKIEEETIRQQRLEDQILDVSRELARSSRHEDRLGNEQGARNLADQSNKVSDVANGQVDTVRSELERAGNASKSMETLQANRWNSEEAHEPFEREELSKAQKGLRRAADELAIESKRTLELLGPLDAALRSSSIDPSKRADDESASRNLQFLKARDMARMLDLLDRQLNQNSEPQSNSQSDERSQTESGTKGKDEGQSNRPSNPSGTKKGMENQDRDGARSAFRDSVKSAAERLASSMGKGRLSNKEASQTSRQERTRSQGKQSQSNLGERDLSSVEMGTDALLPGMTESKSREWGKLREQRAADAVEGRRDEYDPEFEEAIQAYYRVIGNR